MRQSLESEIHFGQRQTIGTISKITYSPVKSAAQIEVPNIRLTPEGLEHDKEWIVVSAQPNAGGIHRWISQRDRRSTTDKPQGLGVLAFVQPHLTPDALHLSWAGQDPIALPLDMSTGTELPIQIWDDVIHTGAVDQGDSIAEWLSDHLEHPVRLVRATDTFHRLVSQKWLPNTARIKGQDSYPMNWVTQASLDELDQRAGQAIADSRFRANITVTGAQRPSIEHEVFYGVIGGIPFANAKPCDRCPVPLIDQATGELSTNGEPLRTLNTYKRWKKPNGNVFVIFGENAIPLGTGEIAVGQAVEVVNFRNPGLIWGGTEIKAGKR